MRTSQKTRDTMMLFHTLNEAKRGINAFFEADKIAAQKHQIGRKIIRENERVFDHLRLGLHFTANVSKVFFASRGVAKERAQRLRSLIELPDNHLIRSRSIRDSIEHMDERLDEWTKTLPRPVMRKEAIIYADAIGEEADLNSFEGVPLLYVEETKMLTVFGQHINIHEAILALGDVQAKIDVGMKAVIQQPGYDPDGDLI